MHPRNVPARRPSDQHAFHELEHAIDEPLHAEGNASITPLPSAWE